MSIVTTKTTSFGGSATSITTTSTFSSLSAVFPTGVLCDTGFPSLPGRLNSTQIGTASSQRWSDIERCCSGSELELLVSGGACDAVCQFQAGDTIIMFAYNCLVSVSQGELGIVGFAGECGTPIPVLPIKTTTSSIVASTAAATSAAMTSNLANACSAICPQSSTKMQLAVATIVFLDLCFGLAL